MADDESDGLGAGFYWRLAGLALGFGILGLILMLIFTRAIYAWGFIGAFIVLALVLLLFGWIYDRRQARAYGSDS